MNKSFVLLFSVKKQKTSNGTAPIYLRITIDSTRAEVAIQRHVLPDKWNHATQKVIGNSEEARSLNTYLKTLE